MKFLYLTPEAISHFIVARQYQSGEYLECISLINLLQNKTQEFNDGVVSSIRMKEGVLLYKEKINRTSGLFFDYEQFTAFLYESSDRAITIFQKVLRFATRYFSGRNNYVHCEIIKGTNGIIFPFPYVASKDAYRVVVDRNGYRDGKTLNFLTVYYSGTTETNISVKYTNLSRFYEEFKTLDEPKAISDTTNTKKQNLNSFTVMELNNLPYQYPEGLRDSDWEQYLTAPQKKFIYKEINGAERLEGAAGTGKTLSLILKCIYNLKLSDFKKRFVFITHSLATKKHIHNLFLETYPEIRNYICEDFSFSGNLLITTVQEWCIKYLGSNLADTEYLDKDAMTSKNVQKLYIESALKNVNSQNLSFYKKILSDDFLNFLECTDDIILYDMLQYEIGVVLKGRADGDLDLYKKLERPNYGIPCRKEVDYNYIHLIYTEYQNLLINDAQFDSDDIVLSALSSLNAPIWRRRREVEGFDACFIDETHLFNFNELSVFPFLNKTEARNNIIFAIDKSQFGGEIMQKAEDVLLMSAPQSSLEENVKYHTVFRSSSSILNLAFNIMSIGSTLFNNFENPLENSCTFTDEQQDQYIFPQYIMKDGEAEMINYAFETVDDLQRKYKISKAECLIVSTSDMLSEKLKRYCNNKNKAFEQIQSRGDSESYTRAKNNNKYLLSGIDYVGGLEFDYVVIIGVDDQRVPPKFSQKSKYFHFSNYAWHRRMYVALTRAKYGVFMIGDKSYGKSDMFVNAIMNKFVDFKD